MRLIAPLPSRLASNLVLTASFAVLLVATPPAYAEVWGYIDGAGHPHVAGEKLDERYQLFFRGPAPGSEPAPADTVAPTPALASAPLPATRFEGLIEKHAAAHDVDPALVKAIVAVESGFQPGAISPKGARGLMQVMPETAARYGVTADRKRSAEQKLLDPAVNVQVGTRYLRDLLARFAQNITLALAAYNAGEMAVERHQNRVPPYPETVEYVKRVQRLYAAFQPAPVAAPAASPSTPVTRVRGTLQPRVMPWVAPVATSNPVLAKDAGSPSDPVL